MRAEDDSDEKNGEGEGEDESKDDDAEDDSDDEKAFRAKTCNDCNKQFCLGQGLPGCKEASEEDILTTCFRTFNVLGANAPTLPPLFRAPS